MVLGACTGAASDQSAEQINDQLNDPWVEAIAADEGELAVEASVALPVEVAVEAQPIAHPIVLARHTQVALGAPVELARVGGSKGSERSASRATKARVAGVAEVTPSNELAALADPSAAALDSSAAQPAAAAAMPTLAQASPVPAAAKPEPPKPAPITAADFAGNFRFVGGQTQRSGVAEAIEATVESLPRLFHRLARKRLTLANPVDERVEVEVVGDQITVEFATGFRYSCSIDGGSSRSKGAEGQRLDVRVRTKGTKLVHLVNSKEGAGTMVFVLSPDRKRLTIHHKVSSPRLPVPVSYKLTYSRS